MLIIFDLDNTLYDCSAQIPDNYTLKDVEGISLFSGVREFLTNFPGKLVLVTHETDSGLQDKKIDMLKIRNLFDKIFICPNNEAKRDCFKQALDLFPNSKTFVVGDRVDGEIKYGNELGCVTVRVKIGKYKNIAVKDKFENPDYEINRFEQLNEIVRP
tara:strand:- start:147 stop:620 length:474 start_codon:yes stop_codon:yes gene_type:complete